VPVPDGGAILSLSLGIGAVGAVARHGLTARDFAPTDLTVEMLYLVEAKTAAMDESRRLNQRLQHERAAAKEQAVTDPLTGLKNRRGLEEALSRLASAGTPYGLIHIDLDRFKAINDTLGHDAGDAMLCAAARAMQAEVREHDIAARVGGDEFVLVFPGSSDPARLTAAAERMIARIEAPVVLKGESCRISASAGIALSHRTRLADAAAILREADAALYEAKRAGRGHARIAS
jgi:diguanylate cyclase (GGDEF)-like protein